MYKTLRNFFAVALMAVGMVFTGCSIDECKDVTCENGGTCLLGVCSCPVGYEGTDCATLMRTAWIGTYSSIDACDGNTFPALTVTISASATSDLVINMSNFYGLIDIFQISTPISATITSSNSVNIASQTVTDGTNSYTFSGTGTRNTGGSLDFTYTVSDGTDTSTCSSAMTIQ